MMSSPPSGTDVMAVMSHAQEVAATADVQKVFRQEETVNHPSHYGGDTTYEVIKVLEAWGLDRDFCLGNVVKYMARAGKKLGPGKSPTAATIEDLEKALWYLDRRVKKMKGHAEPPQGDQ